MAIDDKKQPIIVRKKRGGHGGHHGGSWKVAYADFVTAMMAFFLLMWLLGSTSQAQREGIAEWFKNPAAPQGPGGASTSMIKFGGAMEVPRGEGDPFRNARVETAEDSLADKARLDDLMERLKAQIESTPSLKDFKDQLLLDITSEGLRIQIVDKENRPMFDLGGTRLKSYTRVILHELSRTIDQVPNFVSIAGHTDATPYSADRIDYSNWELSADRANAARREMIEGGFNPHKFGRVVGLADSVLFDKANPYNPVNRRISIIVLNKATQKAIGLDEAAITRPEPAILPPPLPAVEDVLEEVRR
ncbi:MAG: flagellar motor protein MotB [Thiohalomonadaceae bacterium]